MLLASCSKDKPKTETQGQEFGEPIGIELSGTDVMLAVAPEKGHDIPNAAVPELATLLAGAQKECAIQKFVSATVSVKDGKIAATADPKADATNACLTKAIDGKPIKTLGPMALLVQLTPTSK